MKIIKNVLVQLDRAKYCLLPLLLCVLSMHAGRWNHVVFYLACTLAILLLYFGHTLINSICSCIELLLERIEELEKLIDQENTDYEERLDSENRKIICSIFNLLTERQKEVAFLLIRGYTYHEIVDELQISINTIRRHVSTVYEKCAVKNRRELVLLVRDEIKAGRFPLSLEQYGEL